MIACGDRVDCACCARIEELEREMDEARDFERSITIALQAAGLASEAETTVETVLRIIWLTSYPLAGGGEGE